MGIPTEPVGSLPRPAELFRAFGAYADGSLDDAGLAAVADRAVADTVARLAQAGSQVLTDGEQTKPSFATYPLTGLDLNPDGVVIPFADGHVRRLPTITAGPFRYGRRAGEYVRAAKAHTALPVKQAVIAPSALSLLYPPTGVQGYPRDAFIADLIDEAEADIRSALEGGAHSVQLDFTEARLALKIDPLGDLLDSFIALNSEVLSRFSRADRRRIGVHTCPGGDLDSTHSADVDYADLLPKLFGLDVGAFYIAMAAEPDPAKVLATIAEHRPTEARIFIGVIDVLDPRVETAELVRDRVLAAAEHIPVERLGTCDDCGFAPFGDDTSTSRDTAFAKIAARVEGTALASRVLGV